MNNTVAEAIIKVIKMSNKDLTVKEIKELIIRYNLYSFGTDNIEPVIRKTIDRHCENGAKSSQKSKLNYFTKKANSSFNLLTINTTKNDIKKIGIKNIKEYTELESGEEGKKKCRYTTYYERKPKLRALAVEIHGTNCFACGFNFEKTYGEYAKDYIQIHHKKPLFQTKPTIISPLEDLVPLCANCHVIIHKQKDKTLTIEELVNMIS